MTGVLTFETKHGRIAVEVDEDQVGTVHDPAVESPAVVPDGMTAKGPGVAGISSFGGAMETLKAYADNLEDVIRSFSLMPKEVSVEIGLKLKAGTGFIIAKAGTEAAMKVSLTWEPKSGSDE